MRRTRRASALSSLWYRRIWPALRECGEALGGLLLLIVLSVASLLVCAFVVGVLAYAAHLGWIAAVS